MTLKFFLTTAAAVVKNMNTSEWFQWNEDTKTIFVFANSRLASTGARITNETTKFLRQYAKVVRVIVCDDDAVIQRAAFSLTTYPKLRKVVVTKGSMENASICDEARPPHLPVFPVLTTVLSRSGYAGAIAEPIPPDYIQFAKEMLLLDNREFTARLFGPTSYTWLFSARHFMVPRYNIVKIDAACCLFLCLYKSGGTPKDIAKMIARKLVYNFSWVLWWDNSHEKATKKLKTK